MKTLAIIVSYNFMPWIDRCLPSLLQSIQPTDILVVDNASADETVSTIQTRYPQVRLIVNAQNLGFGRANNIGMQIALDEGYDGVLLINQDAWLAPDALEQLVAASMHYPDYGIISPKHLTGDGSKLDPGFAKYIDHSPLTIENEKQPTNDDDQLLSSPNEKKDNSNEWANGQRLTVNGHFLEQRGQSCLHVLPSRDRIGRSQRLMVNLPFINAALWYIPTSVIKKVGLFAPLFYHYGEDKDYANRMHYHGYQIGYVPTAIGYHDRAERPFTHELFIRTERVYHLSEYANINHSFPKAFAYGVLAPVKKALQALIKGKATDFFAFIGITFQLLLLTNKVYQTRQKAELL